MFVLFASLIGGCSKNSTSTPDIPADTSASPPLASLSIGDQAPEWTKLVGIDDASHSLSDLADVKAIAVLFTCNHCPVAVAYEERLVQLTKDYADQPFQLVAINVNNLEEDKLPAMKVRAAEKGFDFPYLYDPSQGIGRAFGATVTPHVFLLDEGRKVAYMGAIDDNQVPEEVEQHHLRDAIDAVLAGQQPLVSSTQQFGCGIKYE